MPLYDFKCPACGETFEARTAVDEAPPCPRCGHPDAVRQMSAFAGPFTVGLRGAAAKRSNAERRAREELRRERREQRGEQRRQRPPGD
jgi:putative FmdB family regulatory protein